MREVTRAQAISAAKFSVARRAAIARGLVQPPRATAPIRRRENRSHATPISLKADPQSVRTFAQQVALATTGPCLRYSRRLHLFELAEDAGIGRFDANLIIAAIEHRAGKTRADVEIQETTSSFARPTMLISAAAIVQIGILAIGWITLLR